MDFFDIVTNRADDNRHRTVNSSARYVPPDDEGKLKCNPIEVDLERFTVDETTGRLSTHLPPINKEILLQRALMREEAREREVKDRAIAEKAVDDAIQKKEKSMLGDITLLVILLVFIVLVFTTVSLVVRVSVLEKALESKKKKEED